MKKLIETLSDGNVAVMKTDTLYGLIGLANNRSVVERIFSLKERNPAKPLIVLIHHLSEIEKMDIFIPPFIQKIMDEYWPGKVTIIIPVGEKPHLHYLHRGTKHIAFRIPFDPFVLAVLQETGPLVAPSANPEGFPPAKNIREAKRYFGDVVHYYHDRGECTNEKPSRIIQILENGDTKVVRD